MLKKLAPNFNLAEFHCKDGTPVPIEYYHKAVLWANILQQLRDLVKSPILVTSAYRTKDHNKKIGGQLRSKHLKLDAVDIIVSGISPDEVAFKIACMQLPIKVLKYKNFLHLEFNETTEIIDLQ